MWDQRYSTKEFVYGTEPNDFLKAKYTSMPAGGRVLCLAEGEGRNAVYLAKQGYSVTAVDQSAEGLKKAQRLAKEQGVTIDAVVADLDCFDLGQSKWDGIVAISAHLPPAIRVKVHGKVGEALTEQGVLILEAYTELHIALEGVGGPPPSKKDMFMSLEKLFTELVGLEFIHGQERVRYLSEGTLHHGESGVVQVVAKKIRSTT